MTADVTDFSLDFTATIISSGLLEDMDLKDLDEVDEMSDSMKKLEEATDKLSDGAGALEEGMETYKTYLNQYLAGVAAVSYTHLHMNKCSYITLKTKVEKKGKGK